MNIQTLTLADFRNYEREKITFCPGTNVIYGDNAQGKTNLLEAVCMFAYGRSKRARSDAELIRFGTKLFRISLTFSDSARSYEAVMQAAANGKKTIKINNVAITRLSQLVSYLNVVMFSPQELDIVKGSPSVRRRFLDEAISQMYPKYMSELSDYHKALEQKNGLLKQLRMKGVSHDEMLSVWNEQLSAAGAAIELRRRKFLERLAGTAQMVQTEISREKLKIDYTPSIDCGIIEKDAAAEYFNRLENVQQREIENGASLMGIQRDDMSIKIGNKEARLYASQGQQRTAVLSLKLAQTEYIYEEKGEYPVLLLDDIMSELDIGRRQFLSGKIKDKQVLITTTDAEGVENNTGAKYFKISQGRLVE
jgi:DNA replication and repair protein RecF